MSRKARTVRILSTARIAAVLPKSPNEILEFFVDWSVWIRQRSDNEVITTSTITVPAGMTKVSGAFSSQSQSVVIDGGTTLTTYDVVFNIVDNLTHEYERVVRIAVL